MKKKTDSDMPVGKLTRIPDFLPPCESIQMTRRRGAKAMAVALPPPEELAVPEDTVKITIALNRSSVEFFKKAAQKHHTKYQKMIRRVLDHYASRYQNS